MKSDSKIEDNLELFLIRKLKNDKLKVEDFQRINKGWETDLYQFTLCYYENSEKKAIPLILRIYFGDSSEKKAEWEFFVLEKLFEVHYPVPKPYFQEPTGSIIGKPFIIIERILGEDQGEIFLKALKNDNKNEIYEKLLPVFCSLFFRLHNLDWRILCEGKKKLIGSDTFNPVDDRLKILEQEIARRKLRLLFPILNWLKDRKNQLSSTKVSIVHRDFHPHNIIINNQGKPFVIDWPACGVGDFREDLGWTLLLIGVYTFEEC
ncbi:MAG: phosphotransferase [Candidatus Heimdallarchaeaceae archaeon]